jgi:aspartate/methionine/tyrosine aminotransferase
MPPSLSKGTPLPGFRNVPRTGVIYVMTEAAKRGFNEDRHLWANLGQGAPETSEIEGAPERIKSISFSTDDHEYAPVAGLPELRDAVAELYNQRYRSDKQSKYTRENVAICAGGRLALTRIVSTLGRTNIGHFIPDYTAYEELLDSFGGFVPIPILTREKDGFSLTPEKLEEEILGRGLSAALLSNPCNPTGSVVSGSQLKRWTDICVEHGCTLILDEFYSHYLYDHDCLSISAAEFVDDVDEDPIVVFDGLTKNWRYPGFRVAWTVGPSSFIDAISSAGSFIDGGCSRVMQIAALDLVKKEIADQEAAALQSTFAEKRRLMLDGLKEMGVKVDPIPQGGFYCWGNLSGLPKSINTGTKLLEKALEKKVIVVPGVFFDINPGQRRPDRASRFENYARFSFGPPLEEIKRGLAHLKELIEENS